MTVAFQNPSFLSGGNAGVNTVSGGVSVSSFYNTEVLDQKYGYQDTRESYEIAIEGRDAAIDESIENISAYLQNGEEDKVLSAYNSLLDDMKSQTRYAQLVTADGNDSQLRAVAKGMIEGKLGCKLSDYIENNASNNASTTYKNILYWGNADSTSSEDLLKEMCNIDKQKKSANPFVVAGAAVASILTAPINFLFGNEKH